MGLERRRVAVAAVQRPVELFLADFAVQVRERVLEALDALEEKRSRANSAKALGERNGVYRLVL